MYSGGTDNRNGANGNGGARRRRPRPRLYTEGLRGPWKKGQSGNPAGRAPGTHIKFSLAQYREALATGELPLQFMLRIMRTPRYPLEQRLAAATAAAPYVHRKQPVGIEVSPSRFGTFTPQQLRELPDEALQKVLEASREFRVRLQQLGVIEAVGQVIEHEASS